MGDYMKEHNIVIGILVVVIIILSSIILSSQPKKPKLSKKTAWYKVKVFKGKMRWYKGTKECFFKHNKNYTVIHFGGVHSRDWRVQLEEIKDKEKE